MRAVTAALALAYGLAFLVVCFGTCLAKSDEHACCQKGQGFTVAAAATDCCHVTSGVSSKVTTALPDAPVLATWCPPVSSPFGRSLTVSAIVPASSSPPRILRI